MKKWLASFSIRLGAVLVRRAHAAAVVVDRVVAAEQDPVVAAQPEVVELVREVADALPVAPADVVELVVRERLGHEHVVVDRHGHQPVAAQQRREDVRRQRDAPRGHPPAVADRATTPAPIVSRRRTGERLEDLDARLLGRARESRRELAGVDERGRVRLPHARRGRSGRRRDACTSRRAQTHDPLVAAGRGIRRPLVEPLELMRFGRHGEGADALPVGVDPDARRCRRPWRRGSPCRAGRACRSRRASG